MFKKLLSQRGISLDRLRNFAAVAESGSIARVADGDPVRQSLISRQIGELEEFFGVELTRRRGKGGVLGEVGEIHAVAIPGGAEWRGFSWPDGVVVDHGTVGWVVIEGVWRRVPELGNGGNTRSKIAQRDGACQ